MYHILYIFIYSYYFMYLRTILKTTGQFRATIILTFSAITAKDNYFYYLSTATHSPTHTFFPCVLPFHEYHFYNIQRLLKVYASIVYFYVQLNIKDFRKVFREKAASICVCVSHQCHFRYVHTITKFFIRDVNLLRK